jgi:hypothetical protein
MSNHPGRLPTAGNRPGWSFFGQLSSHTEGLRDNTRTPIPDQVSFRIDFPEWLATRTERDRRVVEDLALGHRTRDVAQKYGMSAGRVSQPREQFRRDWRRFVGQLPVVPRPVAASA